MFRAKLLDGQEDIYLLKTCATFFRRQLMWAYFLLIDNVFLDTGNTKCNLSQFTRFLEERKSRNDWSIFNTHVHEDHCGNNHFLQQKLGAKIFAPRKRDNFDELSLFFRIYWGRPKLFDCQILTRQEMETSNGRKLLIVPSPGHTCCQVAYHLQEEDILFTGDAIPMAVNKKYSMPEEDYLQAISTLKALLNRIDSNTTVICAHRGVLREPSKYIQLRIENMEANVQKIRELWESGLTDISKLGKEVFGRQALGYYPISSRIGLKSTVNSIIKGINT